jgi:hypothetical protein
MDDENSLSSDVPATSGASDSLSDTSDETHHRDQNCFDQSKEATCPRILIIGLMAVRI